MKSQFYTDRKEAVRKSQKLPKVFLTEELLSSIPAPIQRYFRLRGFVDKPLVYFADVLWEESFIKLKPDQDWRALDTLQFNAVNPIMRSSYMKVKSMFFVGKDLYKDGHGTMIGKILGFIPVMNAKGKEISQAALVTSFSELLLLSGYAFQDYITWEYINDHEVKAILSDHGMTVEGTFHFDELGRFSHFITDDRYFDLGNGQFDKRRFTAKVKSYRNVGQYDQPEEVSVSWILDDGEYEYFKGVIKAFKYNSID